MTISFNFDLSFTDMSLNCMFFITFSAQSWGIFVSIVAELWVGRPGFDFWQGAGFFALPQRPDWL